MEQLKPCPFCGCTDICDYSNAGLAIGPKSICYGLFCVECDASTGWHNTLDEAVKAWNRRADEVVNE